jgi:hypothetical protein
MWAELSEDAKLAIVGIWGTPQDKPEGEAAVRRLASTIEYHAKESAAKTDIIEALTAERDEARANAAARREWARSALDSGRERNALCAIAYITNAAPTPTEEPEDGR